jgi:hypothetical protein
VLAALDGRGVVAVLPERSEPLLASIVRLPRAAFEELHARCHLAASPIAHHEMHVIAGDDVIQHTQAVAHARLVEPSRPQPPVAAESQQELPAVAAMGEVPHMTGLPVAIRARHRHSSAQTSFSAPKMKSKSNGEICLKSR